MANDYFAFKRFTVRQPRSARRVGTDGVLLGAWCDSAPAGGRMLAVSYTHLTLPTILRV